MLAVPPLAALTLTLAWTPRNPDPVTATQRPTQPYVDGVRARVLLVVLLVLGGCYLLVSADAWDPLAGRLGLAAWAVSALALGLIAGGTGRPNAVLLAAALPAVGVAASLPFSRAEEPFTWGFFMLPILGVAGASLVAAGATIDRALRRGGPRTARVGGAAGVLALAAAASAFGRGVWLDQRVVDRAPAHPSTIDDVAGSYRGVGIGDRAAAVRGRLGVPRRADDDGQGFAAPLGQSLSDFDGPRGFDGDLTTWRYRGVAVLLEGSRTQQLVITDPDAETAAGVGIGDSLAVASRRYAHLRCDGVVTGSDATNPTYPACAGHLAGRTGISFYGDPVQSIVLEGGVSGPRLRRRGAVD